MALNERSHWNARSARGKVNPWDRGHAPRLHDKVQLLAQIAGSSSGLLWPSTRLRRCPLTRKTSMAQFSPTLIAPPAGPVDRVVRLRHLFTLDSAHGSVRSARMRATALGVFELDI